VIGTITQTAAPVTEPNGEPESRIGQANAGADAIPASSRPTFGVATLPPAAIAHPAPENVPAFRCTRGRIDGTLRHWDATVVAEGTSPVTGQDVDPLAEVAGWATSPSGLRNEAIRQEILPGPGGPVLEIVDAIVAEHVDPSLGAQLAALPGSDVAPLDIRSAGDGYVDRHDSGTADES
jgi:hypothetical protein